MVNIIRSFLAAACLLGVVAAPAAAIPFIDYYASTGLLYVDTNGENLSVLLVEGPQAFSIDRWLDGTTQDGVTWAQAYFAGKEQWIGVSLTSPPDDVYQIATYAKGLESTDFGEVVFGTLEGPSFTTTVTIRDGVDPVPEPGTLALVGLGLTGWAASRRRRKSGTEVAA